MVSSELESELNKLRSNADSLAQCLGSLLKRIEDLEEGASSSNVGSLSSTSNATAKMLRRVAAAIGEDFGHPDENESEINRKDFVTIDPISGVKKKTTVIERIVSSSKKVQQFKSPANEKRKFAVNSSENANGQVTVFQPRIVSISAEILEKMEIQFFSGEAIVLKIPVEASGVVWPGDVIREISGQPVVHKKQFYPPFIGEKITLKLVPSDIFSLPMDFCKILDDYKANEKENKSISVIPHYDEPSTSSLQISQSNGIKNGTHWLPYLSYDLKKGDVLQVISYDKLCMQARKVNDLSKTGFVPLNINTERVAMLNAYGRRVLLLLGANGVGRRTLKRMLLQKLPNNFASDVPLASRAPKPGEINGREFHFLIKEDFLNLIRSNQMIEWGESNGNLYGTSADCVRQVIRSGRVCVLDCTERSLKLLYNREFMPYVVVIAAPSYEELAHMNNLRAEAEGRPPPTPEMLQRTCEENDKLMNSTNAKNFHLVLVNRNLDITLRRLMDALEYLKNESQWIPLDWLS